MESAEIQPPQGLPKEIPSDRFRKGIETIIRPVVKRPKVEGLEHLSGAENRPVIFATTHLSDADPVIAAAPLLKYRRVDIASLKTNQEAFGVGLKLIGRERFHDVANTFDTEKNMPRTSFDHKNYEEMRSAMEMGRDVVIAAHKPVRDWQLPENAGVGDVYLAHLTESPIFPIAVDIHSETPVGMAKDALKTVRRALFRKQPDVTVRIGTPIKFEKIDPEDLKDAGMILMGQRDELKADEARYAKALSTYELLREQSGVVMETIAKMLPQEKEENGIIRLQLLFDN